MLPPTFLRASQVIARVMKSSTTTPAPRILSNTAASEPERLPRTEMVQQHSALLALPAELRIQIFEYVAHATEKTLIILSPNKSLLLPPPMSKVCNQLRQEFDWVFYSLSLAYVTEIICYNENLDLLPLALSLRDIPGPGLNVNRSITFRITLNNALRVPDIETFVKELSGLAVLPKVAAAIAYQISFDVETFDLPTWRLRFAQLSKRYRFHYSDGEQRVFEKLYWAFAEAAEKVDEISVKQYAMGCWRAEDGRLCFV
ncbi:hypothetical protein LTR56_011605 [Elasticomyces elasticus]|nr:hypothetical protein LTR56_011605 [Elasticomyces elasticus]KAK3656966.1 hypothetical protein LTR22_009467 [Elasticomyces elasticus]KAK4908174.1 hypothetical protein LTR49_022900 [Elasticomyces elasticus]KAK5748148.1 hypothetical protein LTS12_021797 [Elasticomyces elasticus]